MTCIVGIAENGKVVLGGDSAATAGTDLLLVANPKVFRAGPYAIGYTTSFRMGQILHHLVDLPEPASDLTVEALERFMVRDLIEVVRQAYAERGFLKSTQVSRHDRSESGQQTAGCFLLGIRGHLFEIRGDFTAMRLRKPYAAIGSGAPVALGALHALEHCAPLPLKDRALRALQASEEYCAGVRAPFQFVEG